MTGTAPYFSVVIATYNRAGLISRALASLAAQTEKDWEAIVVDDGSTDDTYKRMLPWLRKSDQIRYIGQPHHGEAPAKNKGITLAMGKFITFLDSDDEYDPVHLVSRKAVLTRDPSVKFVYGGAKIIGNQYVPDRFDPTKRINLKNCVIGGTFFIETETAKCLGGFRDLRLGADADLFERAEASGIRMLKMRRQTYIYHREENGSITQSTFLSPDPKDQPPGSKIL